MEIDFFFLHLQCSTQYAFSNATNGIQMVHSLARVPQKRLTMLSAQYTRKHIVANRVFLATASLATMMSSSASLNVDFYRHSHLQLHHHKQHRDRWFHDVLAELANQRSCAIFLGNFFSDVPRPTWPKWHPAGLRSALSQPSGDKLSVQDNPLFQRLEQRSRNHS